VVEVLRRNFVRIFIIFLSLFVIFAFLYSNSPSNEISTGSLGFSQKTNFISYSQGFLVTIDINYDIPESILSNVTIINHVYILRDISSNHTIVVFNYTTNDINELFDKYVLSKPGQYSILTFITFKGNPENVSQVMSLPSNDITFYVSVEMQKPLLFIYPAIFFGIITSAMIPMAVKFGKPFFE